MGESGRRNAEKPVSQGMEKAELKFEKTDLKGGFV